ncbi:MAG: chorismate synthase [Candidatus Margulisbacteria bacterium GWF2_35_9]|nr:MAG: chorismate synthase [Candidatus Margulisbacteria bacterium GWF2_35_9]
MIRYLTAGESHGKALTVIIEGVPAGLEISTEYIETELKRRKQGYGRGGRQQIETDEIEILSGIRFGKTIASPITILIRNKDFENWTKIMEPMAEVPDDYENMTIPRPGHADYAGVMKYGFEDIRNVLERSSARETAMRVVVGSFAKKILEEIGVGITSYVTNIGGVKIVEDLQDILEINKRKKKSQVMTVDSTIEKKMINAIDKAKADGLALGGEVRVVTSVMPIGLGSYVQWDRKLDANIAKAVMSIQAIKGVAIGMGFEVANKTGDKVHDPFLLEDNYIVRDSNNAGGIEGGMSNGEPIIVTAAMKPIPTMKKPLASVNLATDEITNTFYERADVCAVPACSVVCEHVVAIELANALLEKFGGDSMEELIGLL